ncbi:MAG TPA: aminotransferase class V-fold PLP-dependent enzyme [Vicinamibacterales bacterium]|jgi:cysteine desulfurase|nr:aminotransferase class V-fold PLP-dependent enzyme [Vicinamibacterales bacterium]
MAGRTIYLDSHATTPVDPRVLEAMLPFFTERFGNASSRTHRYGLEAADAVQRAREEVASLLGASSREIVFTSGATESNNLAIKGVASSCRERGRRIVITAIEHDSVLDVCARLERDGFEIVRLGVSRDGLISLDELERAIDRSTILVSVMTANNEIGVIQPIAAAARLAHVHGALFHTDAAQAAGKIPLPLDGWEVDLASLTAHKLYGPKGVGALYIRRQRPRIVIDPIMDGGGHEGGLRSGTLNVPGIVGLGRACAVAGDEMHTDAERLGALRDRLLSALRSHVGGIVVNGSMAERLPHNLNVSFEGVEGEQLLLALGDLAVSPGAACASASAKSSHVLRALRVPDEMAKATIRFGLGRSNTPEDVDEAAARVARIVLSLRQGHRQSAGGVIS